MKKNEEKLDFFAENCTFFEKNWTFLKKIGLFPIDSLRNVLATVGHSGRLPVGIAPVAGIWAHRA